MSSPSALLSDRAARPRSQPRLIGLKNRRRQMGLLMLAADLLGFGVAVG